MITEAAEDEGCRHGDAEVAEVEGRLNEACLQAGDLERLHELPDQDIVEVVRHRP
ncbi:methyl coenzyme M reductase gamma subunit [Edaphobacter lichenicola]|uniref:Methyl coenzyme M reductase gamma subunit n=1 Tax=Tunturiibacter lichenicola TaxID=2051959 RepID=A0A7Y9T6Y1_9BACT|nr:methyl coenzyme M reductase gamma subunit [Edaphobacter lichenicola]